jgi:hypothetical protein
LNCIEKVLNKMTLLFELLDCITGGSEVVVNGGMEISYVF